MIAPSQAPLGHRLLGDSDTESLSGGVSIASVHSTNPVEEDSSVDVVHDIRGNNAAIREAFLSLDAVDLHTIFDKRASVMKSVPRFLRGSFRNAMRVAIDEALHENEARRSRGWKLFLLLPGCCFTGQVEAETFQRASWCSGLTISAAGNGHNC